ncbi:MAG: hypothetical protein JSS51_14335 [Planctomycetes bacterium]|nr:hypothetical protein [Planctomycetota bacterium]
MPVKSESSIWGRDGILIGGIAAISIVLLIVVVVLLTPSGRQDVRAAPAVASIPVRPSVQKPGGSEPAADLESGQPRAIQREINGAAKDLSIDPGAATVRFKRAYEAFTRSWNLMSQDEIAAIVSSIVDYCYAASLIDPGVAAIVTEPLQNREPGRLNVRASAAAAAVSGRLLLERELPRETLDSLEERAVFASTGTRVERASTFREGLARNAPALVAEVVEADPASLENWKGIIAVRDAAFGPGQSERDTLVVLALESLLHRTTGSQSEFVKAVSLLAAALSWRPTEELRGAVFGWLEDATVPSPLLSALTLAMVSSSAPGVDSTMVLQPAAGPDARSDLRERLSATWLAEGTAPSMELNIPPDVGAWEKQTVALLEEKPSTAVERLRLAARFASQILLGEALRAGSQAASPADDLAPLPHTLPAAGVVAPGPDAHSKALDYYSAGSSVQARLEILKQFASQRPDLLMADLLVTEAARGSPAAIRDAARKEVVRNAADPSIVLAAIRALPSIPETPENAEWVGQLVGAANSLPKRAKWKPFAERALFDRACGMFPISPDEVAIASVVFDLAETWRERAGAKRVGVEPSAVTAIEQLQAAMSARSPLAKGGPGKLNPADIRRRLDARMVIAQTSMERAVALQSACAEWMALEVAREQPGAIGTVQSLVETWNGERRRAQSSVEQILEGERLMLRLEMLRLQKGAKL